MGRKLLQTVTHPAAALGTEPVDGLPAQVVLTPGTDRPSFESPYRNRGPVWGNRRSAVGGEVSWRNVARNVGTGGPIVHVAASPLRARPQEGMPCPAFRDDS